MKLKTQTDESIIHVQEQTGEMQRHWRNAKTQAKVVFVSVQ